MNADSPLIKTVALEQPAPKDVQEILDSLDKLERSALSTLLNFLGNGQSGNSCEFDLGVCTGYADMLFFARRIDASQRQALASHALDLSLG
ncbi:hypothetical protein K9857_09645 [Pseudomonas sp. REP124]|uniref:hypothetical protein n=1 Tax=Pseudomonas sp. REP124 TaxID=2875731 RepID=UPI001CCAD726|nr:hypothetical protein [Pseudomonas sp. REP124]MBZ9781811.1 hypothetical protein [Pseudomonas sp. REP124]